MTYLLMEARDHDNVCVAVTYDIREVIEHLRDKDASPFVLLVDTIFGRTDIDDLTEVTLCPACNGDGTITRQVAIDDFDESRCDRCDGEGVEL